MTLRPVRDVAQGRWRSILAEIGLDAKTLSGKHGPCPRCGGKDRFRFADKDGHGTWFCNSADHPGGDGMALVMLCTGLDFAQAAKRVEEIAGEAPMAPSRPTQSDEQQRRAMNSLWGVESRPVEANDPVDLWLQRRVGAIAIPSTIRYAPHCRYQDDVVTYHPAMVAKVTGPDGRPVTVHRTYLTADGHKADVPSPRRNMPGSIPEGSAVRLAPAAPTMGIAEGIETAFAASILFDLPVWSALNATMLTKWLPPADVTEVTIFADNDISFAGQRAAYTLAERLQRGGVRTRVMIPDLADTDWRDQLQRRSVGAKSTSDRVAA